MWHTHATDAQCRGLGAGDTCDRSVTGNDDGSRGTKRARTECGAVYPPARNTSGKATAERNAFFPKASKPAAQPQLSALTSEKQPPSPHGAAAACDGPSAPARLLPPKAPVPTAAEPGSATGGEGISHNRKSAGAARLRFFL